MQVASAAPGADTSTEIPGLSLPANTEQPEPPATSAGGPRSSTGARASVFISPDASPSGSGSPPLLSPKPAHAAQSMKPSMASENSSIAANLPMDASSDKAQPAVKAAPRNPLSPKQAGSTAPSGLQRERIVLGESGITNTMDVAQSDDPLVHKLAQAGSMPPGVTGGGEALVAAAAADVDDMMYDAFDPYNPYSD